jgi:hypothetical protein
MIIECEVSLAIYLLPACGARRLAGWNLAPKYNFSLQFHVMNVPKVYRTQDARSLLKVFSQARNRHQLLDTRHCRNR